MDLARRQLSARAVAASTALILLPGVMLVGPADAADPQAVVEGTLDDTTPFRFWMPAEGWNGTVFVDLDAAGGLSSTGQHYVDQGYAYGGTSRNVTGWDIEQALANQVEALERFEDEVGEADRSVAVGASMGGFVAAGVAQEYPDQVEGAVAMCGGLSGTVSQWNQKLDTVFALKHLLAPDSDLPIIDIDDVGASRAAWADMLADAQQTPDGRARIALASAIGQVPAWSSSAPQPDWKDTEAYQAGWYGALSGDFLSYIGQAVGSSRVALTQASGGNPSWNTGIDYVEQLRMAAPHDRRVVDRLYEEAGLSLDDDLATVNAAERIEADPDAVERFAEGLEFDGTLEDPVVTLNNIGDQISTVAQQAEYEDEVRRAGNASLLRQTYVASAGHCSFTDAERITAIDALLDRLDSGHWSGTASAQRLNRHGESLDRGETRFVQYHLPRFNRPF